MRKWPLIIGSLLLGLLIWYLFIKSYDYLITFRVKTTAGTINQSVKTWLNTLENSSLVSQDSLNDFTTQIAINDSIHVYDWKIKTINDSVSQVNIYATDPGHSLKNKILIPFVKTSFEIRAKSLIHDYTDLLVHHMKEFVVKIEGVAQSPAKFCACTTLSEKQTQKAFGMMRDYPLLNSILVDSGAELDGRPMLQITSWEKGVEDHIKFYFCYPVKKSANLPVYPDITYREIKSEKSIKAIYHGNYITSDRAWYALLDYAGKNGLGVSGLPLEVFESNPNLGGDGLDWTAEIYMPLKDDND